MRIVIDMQGVQCNSRFGGIGRYAMAFAQAVVKNRGEHEVILALSGLFQGTIEPIRAAFDGLLPQENIRTWEAPGPVQDRDPGNESRRLAGELLREAFLESLRPDVIHVCSMFEGFDDDAITSIGLFDHVTPVSVTLHDWIPLRNPAQYFTKQPAFEQFYLRKIEHLRQASLYFAISEFTRMEGLTALGTLGDCIVNTSCAVDSAFKVEAIDRANASQLLQAFGICRPFVLSSGGYDVSKNLPRLIDAYTSLPTHLRVRHQLVFAGRLPYGDMEHLRQLARQKHLVDGDLVFTGYVPERTLIQLYNLCTLFVSPSWHEGFPMSALEAMACGAPVIGANASSLPEVIGNDQALFNPFDIASIQAKLVQALEDKSFRNQLRDHGLEQVKRFSWDKTAQLAIASWEGLLVTNGQAKSANVPTNSKPRLAFVSPLPPEQTGIAEYSAELLPALARYYDIELVVAQERVHDASAKSHYTIRDVSWLRAHAHEIDRVLYHIGNSPFHRHMLPLLEQVPGTIVLHDFFLGDLFAWLDQEGGEAGLWAQELYLSHGYRAMMGRYHDAETTKYKFPVNWSVLRQAMGVIVHSKYAHSLAMDWYGIDSSVDMEIIPHVRLSVGEINKQAARKQLGIQLNEFLVCSFGFLGSTKLNHRLLQAWLGSALAGDHRCHLVFVGENPGGGYGGSLLQTIRESGLGERIRITGFASSELYRQYLQAADVAVQLRTKSRGETSGTVLDCMNYGLPLIVNANGSFAELDSEALWMLPEEFTDAALVEALESLWHNPERRLSMGARGQAIIRDRHSPATCAARYAVTIEHFHGQTAKVVPRLIEALAGNELRLSDDTSLVRVSQAVANNLPLPRQARCIFLDVTATCHQDLKTGIERSVRGLVMALLESPPKGYRIEPVYLSDSGGFWHHRYARKYTLELLACPADVLIDEAIDPENGDVLLGLDLSVDALVQADKEGLYSRYRDSGVSVYFMVHDLLPVHLPNVFPPGAGEKHDKWLQVISKYDGAICISNAVADDLTQWRIKTDIENHVSRPYRIEVSRHGADYLASAPSRGLPNDAAALLAQMFSRPSFLMVGTIEPRKAYLEVIDAFSELWSDGLDINLLIVGREGWKDLPNSARRDIPLTVQRLRDHPERNERLLWLEGISDEYLDMIYTASTCLIAASHGEGFGLPLIEAARHKLPIIARDIPVFREVAGQHACYFNDSETEGLPQVIKKWLILRRDGLHPLSDKMPWMTWKQSAARLKKVLLNKKDTIISSGYELSRGDCHER
jgi:glycosyltransferase involved in cell wall biosynthesis